MDVNMNVKWGIESRVEVDLKPGIRGLLIILAAPM